VVNLGMVALLLTANVEHISGISPMFATDQRAIKFAQQAR